MPRLRKGQPIIANYQDRPTSGMIVIIEEIDSIGFMKCRYLAKSLEHIVCVTHESEATHIAKFGVALSILKDRYTIDVFDYSKATYGDGTPRRWQELEQEEQTHLASPYALNLYIGRHEWE